MLAFLQRQTLRFSELNPLLTLQTILGHADPSTTMIYLRMLATDLTALEDALGGLYGLGVSATARRRKDYRIAPPSKESASAPEPELIVEFFDQRGELAQRFDFSALGAPSAMATELALAFRNHLADKGASVRAATFNTGVRNWLRFLAQRECWAPRIDSLREVDRAPLCEFIAALDRLPHRVGEALLLLAELQADARLA